MSSLHITENALEKQSLASSKCILVFIAIAATFFVAVEICYLSWNKVAIQKGNCWIPEYMHLALPFEANEDLDRLLAKAHKMTGSFFWLEFSSIVACGVNFSVGRDLYVFLVLGHVIKNFSKTMIASPRGFWFCTSGNAFYCGRGYSLPSGHSMMYLSALLFVFSTFEIPCRWPFGLSSLRAAHSRGSLPKIPRFLKWILFFLMLLVEVAMLLNIMFIGTHTPADVIIGVSYGVWWFFSYSAMVAYFCADDAYTFSSASGATAIATNGNEGRPPSPPDAIHTSGSARAAVAADSIWMKLFVAVLFAATTMYFEYSEKQWDISVTQPPHLVRQFEQYCSIPPGKGYLSMRNSDAYSKSWLIAGMALSFVLIDVFNIRAASSISLLGRLVRALIGWYCFRNLSGVLRPLVGKYGHYFLQSLYFMIVLPVFFSVVDKVPGLGGSSVPLSPSKKRKQT